MTDSQRRPPAPPDSGSPDSDSSGTPFPEELPPVQPPSAGMIVQLFLVPAMIVMVIVGVYALFGRLVTRDFDWRQLTTDVRSENSHVRWRGALGLAQMLDADARKDLASQEYTSNPEIASALSELYGRLLLLRNPNDEETKQIEFLSKALGRMNAPNVIVPVLRQGIKPERNSEVRKHSLIALAMIGGNLRTQGKWLGDPGLADEIIAISQEPELLSRHQAAFLLGFTPQEQSRARLEALLEDPDLMTRMNAAISFARNHSTQGVAVFHELLQEGIEWKLNPSAVTTPEQEATYFERMLMLTNGLTAIDQLNRKFSPEDRKRFREQIQTLSETTQDVVLRTQCLQTIASIDKSGA